MRAAAVDMLALSATDNLLSVQQPPATPVRLRTLLFVAARASVQGFPLAGAVGACMQYCKLAVRVAVRRVRWT